MSWKKENIRKVIHEPISGEWGDEGDQVHVIRTTNFCNDGSLDLSELVTRNISISKVQKKKLLFGDTILEKSGGSLNQPVGRVVYFNVRENGKEYLCNNFTTIIRAQNNVDSKYLFWFLFQNHSSKQTLKYQNKTTGILNLKTERYLDDLYIPLPPLSTQQKIAAILDKADELRRKDKTLLEKYDALLQSIFYKMFGDPVKNEKGWDTKTIEELVKKEKHSIKRGPFGGALKKEIFVPSGYLVYEQYHALNNDFSFERYYIDNSKFQELIAFEVKPGDIIISCSGIYLGKLAIVPENAKRGIINQALLKITLDQNIISNDFFIFLFSHESFRKYFFGDTRGSGIPNFPPMEEFKEFEFIYPPISLQNRFSTIAKNIESQKLLIKSQIAQSENLFQTLLQKAFKGELVN